MRSGELIRLLKQADPSGEGFIMDNDGDCPRYFEEKPGYYDGAYRYIDEQGRLVISTKENKVDISSYGIVDAAWSNLENELSEERSKATLNGVVYPLAKEEWAERLKEQFIFHDGVPKDFRENILVKAAEHFDEWWRFTMESDEKWNNEGIEKCKSGSRFFAPKKGDSIGWGPWREVRSGKDDGVCCGLISALCESGLFERVDHDEDWWEWRLKP